MSKSMNRKTQKSIQKRMGVEPNAKALEIAMKNAKGFSAKANGPTPTEKP